MLSLENEWKKDEYGKSKEIEYRKMDFYGPFLKLLLTEDKNGIKKVTPKSVTIETAEVSESHFYLLSEASKELYSKIGKFILCIPKFDIEIKIITDNVESLLYNTLISKFMEKIKKDIPLF